MAYKSPDIQRRDGSRLSAGAEGDVIAQEPGSGKAVHRRGADEANADIDIGTAASPRDLDADGDYESDNRNVGGAEALAGEVVSDDGATFTVYVDWLNDDNEVVITHSPSALTDVTDVDFNLIVRSDRFKVRVEDTSGGQNRIHGTINAH